jgi:hypothetical protein
VLLTFTLVFVVVIAVDSYCGCLGDQGSSKDMVKVFVVHAVEHWVGGALVVRGRH